MIAFRIQLADKKVRVVLHPRGHLNTLYAYFSYKGQRHNITTGQTDETAARKEARRIVEECAATSGRPVAQSILTLAETYVVTRWPQRPDKPKYIDAKGRITRFAEWCSENGANFWPAMPFLDASATVQRYIDHRRKTVVPQTLHNERWIISAFASFLIRRNLTDWTVNPASSARIELPRIVRVIKPPLSPASITKFLTHIRFHDLMPVCVLLLSGLRPRAVIERLEWPSIDLKTKQVITTEKSRSRQLPLSDWAVTELSRFAKTKGRVWQHARQNAFVWCKAEAVAACTPEITLQALRRAFIFRLWQSGVSPQLASKLAGNTVETAMRHYADSSLLDARPVVNLLDWTDGTKSASKS